MAMHTDPNDANTEPNYHNERGSAAAVADQVQAQTIVDPQATTGPMDQDGQPANAVTASAAKASPTVKAAPSTKAAPTVVTDGKKLKRGADAALSPGYLSRTTDTPKEQRRPQHIITGVDQDFRLKVKEAVAPLELTRDVKELQVVMDQVTKTVMELQRFTYEQEARLTVTNQRLGQFDPKVDKL